MSQNDIQRKRKTRNTGRADRLLKLGLRGEDVEKISQSGWGLATRSQYQRRICELEMELSRLQRELDGVLRQNGTLRLAQEQYRDLYQSGPIPHVLMDLFGKIIDCNAAFLLLVEMEPEAKAEMLFSRLLARDMKRHF